MYIYAEYLILENLIINYIILYITKKFTRTQTSTIRLLIASLIGALYTLVVFFPSLIFMTRFIVKISISILIIIVAFNPIDLTNFVKQIATFYVVSFVFAGAALALFYFTNGFSLTSRGIFYIKDFPVKLLITAVILSGLLIKATWGFIQMKIRKNKIFVPIKIRLNNKQVEITALLDTGNSLKDPITESPVIIVEFSAISMLFPREVQDIFLKYNENNLEVVSAILSSEKGNIKFRLIPFKSIGKENGMLLGFKPDLVVIEEEGEEKVITDIVIGIYNSHLSSDDKYMALLHPEVLN